MTVAAPSQGVYEALAGPGIYPGRTGRVSVHETHISWVFLAGKRAYKLKKPLVLPFLDYGSPQRRREMCREEVRLNRRLAPDLYLGVRSIAARDGGFELADEEDPRAVDYLVEMRRYDEQDTLAAKLQRGELMRSEIAAVAGLLARFHERAERVGVSAAPALTVRRRVSENAQELLAIVQQQGEVERVLALERFADAFAVAHAGSFDTRAWRGFVRDVHGDLRAEHVLVGDPPQVIDCIEFAPALRELDVADDLAFLLMDLTSLGGQRFAEMLLTAYREAGGDPGEDRLIAFYASYRAQVRAKVELLRAAQHPSGSAPHGHHSAAARDLLAVAERFAWQARLPLVIAVCGLPASGKSQLAEALSAGSGLPHLSSDVTRKRLAGIEPDRHAPAALYGEEWDRRTYAELGRRAAQQTRSRGGAIVDATFRRRADREAFAETFADAAPVLFVECQAPRSVLLERAAMRERDRGSASDASLALVAGEAFAWDSLEEVGPDAHLALRSDRPVETLTGDLQALLDRRLVALGSPAPAR